MMDRYLLSDDQIEDIEDLLPTIENSLNVKFEEKELLDLNSVDDLCNLISRKAQGENTDICTSLRFFLKLRKAISKSGITQTEPLRPQTKLENVFPRKNRRNLFKSIEQELGIKLKVFVPQKILHTSSFVVFVVSFVTIGLSLLFGSTLLLIGVTGISLSVLGLHIANRVGKDFKVETVRELIESMVAENYINITNGTVNRGELKNTFLTWLSYKLGIDKIRLANAYFK